MTRSQNAPMSERQLITSGGPWEASVGYSRAVRVGNQVAVSGTIAVGPDGEVVAPGDAYLQAKAIFVTIGAALDEAGASLDDVVRTRSFITDLSQWEGFGRAHREAFSTIRPAATLVQVAGLVGDGTVIEIEVDAVVTSR